MRSSCKRTINSISRWSRWKRQTSSLQANGRFKWSLSKIRIKTSHLSMSSCKPRSVNLNRAAILEHWMEGSVCPLQPLMDRQVAYNCHRLLRIETLIRGMEGQNSGKMNSDVLMNVVLPSKERLLSSNNSTLASRTTSSSWTKRWVWETKRSPDSK